MAEIVDFKCLRCEHEFTGPYDRKIPTERACPKCNSNSVRKIKKSIKK
jgi:DNA-directed RNA polymerase subunit RPC12/RpoP